MFPRLAVYVKLADVAGDYLFRLRIAKLRDESPLAEIRLDAQVPDTDAYTEMALIMSFMVPEQGKYELVPGAQGTYPMSINASMAVAGYYYVSATLTRGFLRDADGTMTTFTVQDGVQTVPESINDAGEITGFYEDASGYPRGFLRYADGQIITFDPSCAPQFQIPPPNCLVSLPVSINAFGVIAGNYPIAPVYGSAGFIRSRAGVLTSTSYSAEMHGFPTRFTGLNASGATVGHFSTLVLFTGVTDVTSFLLHPSGYLIQFSVPVDEEYTSESTAAESINDDGVIAGWYSVCFFDCASTMSGGFVRSPEGRFTLFILRGQL